MNEASPQRAAGGGKRALGELRPRKRPIDGQLRRASPNLGTKGTKKLDAWADLPLWGPPYQSHTGARDLWKPRRRT